MGGSAMSDLLDQLKRIRSRARRVLWTYGLSWTVAVLLGAALCVAALDWLLHRVRGPVNLDDSGVRLMLALGIVAAAASAAWRFLITPLRQQLSDLDVALRIERRFPGFQDSLASTVQFLEQGTDPRLGSPDLQRAVIERTARQVEDVNLADVIDPRPARRVAVVAVLVCLAAALLAGLNPAAANVAVNRLVFPLASHPWPRATELRLLDAELKPLPAPWGEPIRRVRGDTLRFYVENVKGTPPDDVMLEYRFAEGETTAEKLRRASLRDAQGSLREVCVATIVVDKGPLEFRAIGGDDHTMDWHDVEVVPPPRLDRLQVTLTPPTYAGRPAERLPENVGHVQALVGTTIEIEATSNKPLASALLHVKDASPKTIELSKDGLKFKTAFTLSEPGLYSYWFDLTDRTGFKNPAPPHYEIRADADRVPVVNVVRPLERISVTARAVLPVQITAEDDLGLKELRLRYRLADGGLPIQTVALQAVPDLPRHREVTHRWKLSSLAMPLPEGAEIEFWAEAADRYDLGPGHVGRSESRLLRIVSPQEKAAEIGARQVGLLEELERIAAIQRQAHEQVGELKVQLRTVGRLRPREDVNLLKRIEQDQREITSRLAGDQTGVEPRTRQLLAEMEINRVDDPALRHRLEMIAGELSILRLQHLPKIEKELTDARKLAEAAAGSREGDRSPAAPEQDALLNSAQESQRIVLEALGAILGELTESRNRQNLAADLKELIGTQESLNRAAAELTARTLSKRFDDLADQEQADLMRISERQRRHADRVDQLLTTLEGLAGELGESNPSTAQTLADAANHVRSRAVAARMREAAAQLERNLVGETTRRQQQILEDLKEIESILQSRAVSDAESLLNKLSEAERALDALRERQEELQQQLKKAAQVSDADARRRDLDRIAGEQRGLRDETARLARRLRRLQAAGAAGAAERSARRMRDAADETARDQTDRAADRQGQALDDLLQAQSELARSRQALEAQLARDRLQRLGDELGGLIARQQAVIDGTGRLDEELKRLGNWSRARLMQLAELTEEQRKLVRRTEALIEPLKGAEVFALALRGAARQMKIAADRLADRQTDQATIDAEKAARRRLEQLIGTLDPADNKTGDGTGATGGGGEGTAQSGGIDPQSQLALLKALQEDLARRTAELDSARKDGGLAPEQQSRLDRIALEQGELADLARGLRESLLGRPDGGKPEEPPDPLQRAVEGMQTAKQRLAARQTGTGTQQVQKQVVRDLEELIRLAARQQQSPQSAGAPDGTPQKPRASENQTGKPKTPADEPVEAPTVSSPDSEMTTGDPGKKPSEADPRPRDEADAERVRMARRRQLIDQIWGHLPPAARQELQNVKGEQYLPKYNDLIRQYFESLAE